MIRVALVMSPVIKAVVIVNEFMAELSGQLSTQARSELLLSKRPSAVTMNVNVYGLCKLFHSQTALTNSTLLPKYTVCLYECVCVN